MLKGSLLSFMFFIICGHQTVAIGICRPFTIVSVQPSNNTTRIEQISFVYSRLSMLFKHMIGSQTTIISDDVTLCNKTLLFIRKSVHLHQKFHWASPEFHCRKSSLNSIVILWNDLLPHIVLSLMWQPPILPCYLTVSISRLILKWITLSCYKMIYLRCTYIQVTLLQVIRKHKHNILLTRFQRTISQVISDALEFTIKASGNCIALGTA